MKSGNIQVGGYNDSIFSPSSLIQNRIGDFGVTFTHLRRSALQPFLQCTATAPAVHCIRPCSALHPSLQCTASFPANVCTRHRKRLHPPSQTFASAIANVCGEKMPFMESLPPGFSTEPKSRGGRGFLVFAAAGCSPMRHSPPVLQRWPCSSLSHSAWCGCSDSTHRGWKDAYQSQSLWA